MEIIREDKQGRKKYYANNESRDFEIESTQSKVEISIRGHNATLTKEKFEQLFEILQDMKERLA